MGAAVLTFNSYTKTIFKIHHQKRLRLEEACAAPSNVDVVSGGGIYSVSGLQQIIDMWLEERTEGVKTEVDVLIGGCEPEECEDCESEMEEAMEKVEKDSPCI